MDRKREPEQDDEPRITKKSRWDQKPQVEQEPELQYMDAPIAMDYLKPEDVTYFGKLMHTKRPEEMSIEEAKDRKVLKLLLKIKNGDMATRKQSQRQLVDRVDDLGHERVLDKLLPLLMSPTLEDAARHFLVKTVGKMLLKLQDQVKPFVHKILVVIQPLLVDQEYHARMEGRELVQNLSKAAGLAAMISALRPDIDSADDFVRNITARSLAIAAQSCGVAKLLPFVKAVCQSSSWHARHTGCKVIQQISVLVGSSILPFLYDMVDCIRERIYDDEQKVRVVAAQCISSMAQVCAPLGIEAIEPCLEGLWQGLRRHRGKALASFMRAIGFVIPLMDIEYGRKYTLSIVPTLVREFSSPDDEVRLTVLSVINQCCKSQSITPVELDKIVPDFIRQFWTARMVADRKCFKSIVETSVSMLVCLQSQQAVMSLVPYLKDRDSVLRSMAVQILAQVVPKVELTVQRDVTLLIDGLSVCFQQLEDKFQIEVDCIAKVLDALGLKCKNDILALSSMLQYRLQNKSPMVRMQSAVLTGRFAPIITTCEEIAVLQKLAQVLYESIGEDNMEALGQVLYALAEVLRFLKVENLVQPSVKELVPRLTPLMKFRHDTVQLHCISLIGLLAESAAKEISAKEWMRLCFELLESLKSPKKSVRRGSMLAFGHIAKAIGPSDVLITLLNNLKVQERQQRVGSTIAIAVVADACEPFTVLPALMNEYRTPDLNVQNGVLRALTYMFEYTGDKCKDYIYSVIPVLEDALIDRDVVHRQIACLAVKQLAVNCDGQDVDDALQHLLNLVWPNVFETEPHMADAFIEAVEALGMALGSGVMMQFLAQGLFHPARKVRSAYWKVYQLLDPHQMVPYYPTHLPELEL